MIYEIGKVMQSRKEAKCEWIRRQRRHRKWGEDNRNNKET
jgi:hypothetical protein